ncbi:MULTISPECIES: glycoside hydrolase family 2 TIM barrel-domain containing protein [unclassified Carboxylicivirga]|uniref:glycoside hydrolase family 2 TIM barrel-domain containing protein n=1 Tax=Carboxylicivirga TaxID=1628153 RepID=UPI003D34A5E2
MLHRLMIVLLLFWAAISAQGKDIPEFSTAGFFQLDDSGRDVYSMNVGWRFFKGASLHAYQEDFDDTQWPVVALPHGIEYLPTEASGCVNYQGEVWYRKHFTPDPLLKGKKLFLHFEAIMGKSKVWINGHQVAAHFGGFLPVIADVTPHINWEGDNVVAVLADNSNDPLYPPGKQQETLDFAYFGGIYRDCWLVAHNHTYLTDPNYEDQTAGGGLLVAFDKVSEQSAEIHVKAHLRNELKKSFKGSLEYTLVDKQGDVVSRSLEAIAVRGGKARHNSRIIKVQQPHLWSPETPYLYNLQVRVKDAAGKVIDGYRQRVGIRSIAFKGQDGFWLNGKPYPQPIMGANRHQDFAVLGNALPNSLHWRDAKKLRDVGLKVIRNAHYPQDPAFMDACDELGLFVIVNTPGWQFWNDDPIFEKRVFQDIRNMVRRDRNRASIWLWEPILNETWYPDDFAKNTRAIVEEEYPYPGCYCACDAEARGNEHFDILFGHPPTGDKNWALEHIDPNKTYYTREWGDNVDDWNSHNSPSRVNKSWGEQAMLIQANHYAKPDYTYTCFDALHRTTRQHVGGALWHSFDHQRGYHPDPFYGGIMDAFRQPKYSYALFKAQRDAQHREAMAETGPIVFIAHEMTPFSSPDVTVYSNCDEVRLQVFENGKEYCYTKEKKAEGIPNPIIVFDDVFDFMEDKALSRDRKQHEVYMQADGYIKGKKVASHRVAPARRPSQLLLWLDDEDVALQADGSDCVTVVAAVADKDGNIKRLNNYFVKFAIEGEGKLVGDASIMANPRPVNWGTAPILVQSSTIAGSITVKASVLLEGSQMPMSAELTFSSVDALHKQLYNLQEWAKRHDHAVQIQSDNKPGDEDLQKELDQLKRELNALKLKEVERQQEAFGEKK